MHYKKYMLPEDLFLTVFNTNREYISNSINTIWQKKNSEENFQIQHSEMEMA